VKPELKESRGNQIPQYLERLEESIMVYNRELTSS
jgi:hypothetical protein